jgi:hypothetical protein
MCTPTPTYVRHTPIWCSFPLFRNADIRERCIGLGCISLGRINDLFTWRRTTVLVYPDFATADAKS